MAQIIKSDWKRIKRILTSDLAAGGKDRVAILVADVYENLYDKEKFHVIIPYAERLPAHTDAPIVQKTLVKLIEVASPDAVCLDFTGLGNPIIANIYEALRESDNKTPIYACDMRGPKCDTVFRRYRPKAFLRSRPGAIAKNTSPIWKEGAFGILVNLVDNDMLTFDPAARELATAHSEFQGIKIAIKTGKIDIANDAVPGKNTSQHDDFATAGALLAAAIYTPNLFSKATMSHPAISNYKGPAITRTPEQEQTGIDGATAVAARHSNKPDGWGAKRRGFASIYSMDIVNGPESDFNGRGWPDRP